MKILVISETGGSKAGTNPISVNSQKNPSIVRRGEGSAERLGGPLWPPAGEVGKGKKSGAASSSTPQLTSIEAGSAMSNPPTMFDSPSQYKPYEHDIAHRWWALSTGDILPLSNGDTCQILFAGRPGSASGPDIRDAVLGFTTRKKSSSFTSTGISTTHSQAKKLTGDVEFHVRASDWYTHRHHTDPRYNNVILHVVLICDDTAPTQRQDGTTIPVCSLYDLHHLDHPSHLAHLPHSQPGSLTTLWPCHTIMPLMSDQERINLLRYAGLLRFEQKTHAFVEQLHNAQSHASFTTHDTCLIPALAEGLGYGRDRAIFRAAGLHLLSIPNEIPEPLGHTPNPSPLDTTRLHILHTLINQWCTRSPWETIRETIMQTPPPVTSPSPHVPRRGRLIVPTADSSAPRQSLAMVDNPTMSNYIRRDGVEGRGGPCARPGEGLGETSPSNDPRFALLRTIFTGLSPARTDILICNIVLPFAAAVALIENNTELAEQARNLYLSYSALPSNSITRAMCKQLQLPHEPQNACQQQGLHYIYAQTCREKHCAQCIAGRHPL